jgi:hypothetical protein
MLPSGIIVSNVVELKSSLVVVVVKSDVKVTLYSLPVPLCIIFTVSPLLAINIVGLYICKKVVVAVVDVTETVAKT